MKTMWRAVVVLVLVGVAWADEPGKLPPLNEKVLQFAKDNRGKAVSNGECAMLVLEAFAAAKARMPTPEESLSRVFGRRLKGDEKPLPGDIVEFKDVRLEAKDGGGSLEALFHTTILLAVREGKFVLLHQSRGKPVAELDLSRFELKKGELIVYRPVPPGTQLPKTVLPAPKGSWAEKLAANQRVRYLSDLQEFDVKVAEGRFAKKGNLGFGAGNSFRIRVNEKESPNGMLMVPPSDDHSRARYKLGKVASTLNAFVALNDSSGAPGRPAGEGNVPTPVTFLVLGDGKVLWKSKPVDVAKNVQECKIDVTGVDVLELRVDCPGSAVNALPVWLEPRVLLK